MNRRAKILDVFTTVAAMLIAALGIVILGAIAFWVWHLALGK